MALTPEQRQEINKIRQWATREKRKSDLPTYGTAYRKRVEDFEKSQIQQIETGSPPPVKLSTGEFVDSGKFYSLPKDEQSRLKSIGIDKYNAERQAEIEKVQQEQEQFEAENIKLDTGEYISKDTYEKLPEEHKTKIKTLGIEKYNTWQQQQVDEFKLDHVYIAPQTHIAPRRTLKVKRWLKRLPDIEGQKGERYTTEGVWIEKEAYEALPSEHKQVLKDWGIEGYEDWLNKGGGEARNLGFTLEIEGPLPDQPMPGTQDIGKRGVPKGELIQVSKTAAAYVKGMPVARIEGKSVPLVKHGGVFWKRDDWEKIPQAGKLAAREGLAQYNKWAEEVRQNFAAQNIKLKSGEYIPKEEWTKLTPAMQKDAMAKGVKSLDISDRPDIWQFKQLQEWGLVDKKYDYIKDRVRKNEEGEFVIEGQPLSEKYAEQLIGELDKLIENPSTIPSYLKSESAQLMPDNVIEKLREVKGDPQKVEAIKGMLWGIIPIAGTMYHWQSMKPWQKGLSTAIDVATFIPFIGMVSAGVRSTARVGTSMAKAVTVAVGKATLAEIKAPITAIRHPVKTAQTIAYPIETVLRPSKIPITAIELRENTIKLPVDLIGNAKTAKIARDVLVDKAIKGEDSIKFVKDGLEINLAPIALQKVGGAAAVHATPDISVYLNGATVKYAREGGLFMSPSYYSRFSYSSAFGDIPKTTKAMPGAIIIRDKRILDQMVPSDKIYMGRVEIEKVVPAGVKLPPPSQILHTRTVDGDLRYLAVFGDKFTPAQIAKLKLMGSADVVTDIFRPAATIKGAKMEALEAYRELIKNSKKMQTERMALDSELGKLLMKEGDLYEKLKSIKTKLRKGLYKESQLTKIEKIKLDTEKKLSDVREGIHTIGKKINAIDDQLDRIWSTDTFDFTQYIGSPSSALRPVFLSINDFLENITYRNYAQRNIEELARFTRGLVRSDRDRVYRSLTTAQANRLRVMVDRAGYTPSRSTMVNRLRREAPRRATPVPPRRSASSIRRAISRLDVVPSRRVPVRRTPIGVPPVIPPPVTPPPKVPPPTITWDDMPEEYKKLTPAQKIGAVAWKQGFMYKLWYPPYHQDNIINTLEPIPGVKYHEGPGSAYKSLIRLRGPLAKDVIMRDMGIVDIRISGGMAKDRSETKIHYKSDPKQKTLVGAGAGRIRS